MRNTYPGAGTLRAALRQSVERGGTCALGALHQGVPRPDTLTCKDAAAQTARNRRQPDRLQPVPSALLAMGCAGVQHATTLGARGKPPHA